MNFDFVNSDFDCTSWDKIPVPSQIQLEGYDISQYTNRAYPWDGVEEVKYSKIPTRYNPVAQYAKYVDIAEVAPRSFICFDGVETAFALWVNGEFVGYSEGSYTPANFELTDYVTKGSNKIAVAVFKFSTGSWLEDQDFWRMSGIMRDVYIYTTPTSRIKDFYFKTDVMPAEKSAKVKLAVDIENSKQAQNIVCEISDADGKIIYENAVCATDETVLDFSLTALSLWSAEHPNLYTLTIKYTENGEELQTICYKVGFRRANLRRTPTANLGFTLQPTPNRGFHKTKPTPEKQ